VSTTNAMLIAELNGLLRLTRNEELIAEIRRAQARDKATERELHENAGKCRERAQLISQAIRDLGGAPDRVGGVAGRVAGFATTQLNQGMTLREALLGDLALEHQLLERTLLARTLAETAGRHDVVRLTQRLETAHTATVEWLQAILGQLARGEPTRLRPTPVQLVLGLGRRVVTLPTRSVSGAVNRTLDVLRAA
jgi:hypothetical protein